MSQPNAAPLTTPPKATKGVGEASPSSNDEERLDRSNSHSSQYHLGASLPADAFTPLMASQQTMQHHSTDVKVLQHLDYLVARFNMEELFSQKGGPYLTLLRVDRGEQIGTVRVLRGGPVEKLVLISLTLPAAEMESYLLFAFSSVDSILPHYMFNVLKVGLNIGYSIDLIPRVDLGSNPEYMQIIYNKVQDVRSSIVSSPGVQAAVLSRPLSNILSPFSASGKTSSKNFRHISTLFDVYLNHWVSMLELGGAHFFPNLEFNHELTSNLRSWDLLLRKSLFNPTVDPTWAEISKLCGRKICGSIVDLLIFQGFIPPSAQVSPVIILGNSDIANKASLFISQVTSHFGMENISLSQQKGVALELLYEPSSPRGRVDDSGKAIGFVKLYRGGPLEKLIHIQILNQSEHKDHHLIFGLTSAKSIIPHLFIELEKVRDEFSYKVDLVPKVDIMSTPNYYSYYYEPVNSIFDRNQEDKTDSPSNSRFKPESGVESLRNPRHRLISQGLDILQIKHLSPEAAISQNEDVRKLQLLSKTTLKLIHYWSTLVEKERNRSTGLVFAADEETISRDKCLRDIFTDETTQPMMNYIGQNCGSNVLDEVKKIVQISAEDHEKYVAVVLTDNRLDFVLQMVNRLLEESFKVKLIIPVQDHPSGKIMQPNVIKYEVNLLSSSAVVEALDDCWSVIICNVFSNPELNLAPIFPTIVGNILQACRQADIHRILFLSRQGSTRTDSWSWNNDLKLLKTAEDIIMKSRLPYTILRIGDVNPRVDISVGFTLSQGDRLDGGIGIDSLATICSKMLKHNSAANKSFDVVEDKKAPWPNSNQWADIFSCVPPWVPESYAVKCHECRLTFSFTNRKHHCRGCGEIFCGSCTLQECVLPQYSAYKGPQRVCKECFIKNSQ